MARLVRFLDDDRKGRWANLVMDNGDPCWISIAQTGVLVKKSKVGLFGSTLYEEKNIAKVAEKAIALNIIYTEDLTPYGIKNPVLKALVNAILRCSDLAGVMRVLNRTESIEVEDNDYPQYLDEGSEYEYKSDAAERIFEERLYEKALSELEDSTIRKGLWAKALAHSSGDEKKAESLYLTYRVQSLYDEEKKSETVTLKESTSMDSYLPIDEFAKNKILPVSIVLKRIQEGVFQGRVVDGRWHVKE